ncbi:MAG: AI-2E family transporter, partial [Geobacter sp.]
MAVAVEVTMSTKQPALNILVALFLFAALFAAGYALQHTVSTFLLSFVIAYLLDPLVVILERRKINRLSGIAVVYIALGIVGVFCFAFLVPSLSFRWESLLTDLPRYVQKGKDLINAGSYQPMYATEEWRWLLDKLAEGLDTLISKFGSGMYNAVGRVAFNLLNLLLAPILVFFMLYYKQDICQGITSWIPVRQRTTILELGREINSSVGGYLRGQMIVSLIVAVLSTAALLYLNIDYALLNGIFAGLASILPFIG